MSIRNKKGRILPKRYLPLLFMTIPGLAYLFVNNYLPMFGLIIAFKNINFAKGILRSDWVGLQNFQYLFSTSDALTITRNTLLYNGAFIVINLVIAVTLAILLNEVRSKTATRIYQSLILLPTLISMVIVSYLALAFLNVETGFLNKSVLPAFGAQPIPWYSSPQYWPFILTFVNTWKNVGFLSVIYYAAIVGIDPEMYEAATIDGASKLQQVRNITLPMIVPVMITLTLLAIGRIFYSDFGLFYQVPLDSGILYGTTSVIDTYVYHALIILGDIGMSSAAGLYQALVGFVLVLASNMIVRRISNENALF